MVCLLIFIPLSSTFFHLPSFLYTSFLLFLLPRPLSSSFTTVFFSPPLCPSPHTHTFPPPFPPLFLLLLPPFLPFLIFFSVSLPFLYFFSHTLQTDQGIKNLSVDRAAYLSGVDPDYSLKDLYEAIANRNFVSCVVYSSHIQAVSIATQ